MGLHLTGSSVTGLSNAFAALPKVAATVSVDGAAVVNKHNPVDASGAVRAISLPAGQPEGTQISVEKVDASTNLVNVTGSIRGVGSSTLPLAWRYESILFRADSAGSWWPIAGHKTKSSLDAAYDPIGSAAAASSALTSGMPFATTATFRLKLTRTAVTTNYTFPARIRPPEPRRQMVKVRNDGTTDVQLAFGTGDYANFNTPTTWGSITITPGQEYVDNASERPLFARPATSGQGYTITVETTIGTGII